MSSPKFVSASASSWPDRLGIWTSTLCVVHCLLTPVLLSLSAVFAHLLPAEEHTHRTLAVLIALLGVLALLRGYRDHRRSRVLWLMLGGLGCIFLAAFGGDHLHSHLAEVGVTFCGSMLMITAHRLNHTFCKSCSCAQGCSHGS